VLTFEIAQHFGVPTPLLDWSQSIFAAMFFALRDVFADSEFEESLMVYVKKLIDLMKGFGFTGDYFFPDYAGIAHAVMSDTSL